MDASLMPERSRVGAEASIPLRRELEAVRLRKLEEGHLGRLEPVQYALYVLRTAPVVQDAHPKRVAAVHPGRGDHALAALGQAVRQLGVRLREAHLVEALEAA